MLLYLSVHRNPLAAQCLQRSLRSIRRLKNEKIFSRNLLNSLFSSSACWFFESEPVCSPAGPQEPSALDYFGKKFFVQIQIKEKVHKAKARIAVINCVWNPGNLQSVGFLFLRRKRLCYLPNMVRNVVDNVNSNKLHPLYFHGIPLLQEVLLYLTQIKKKKQKNHISCSKSWF